MWSPTWKRERWTIGLSSTVTFLGSPSLSASTIRTSAPNTPPSAPRSCAIPEERKRIIWERQLQGPVPIHRSRTGETGKPLASDETGRLQHKENSDQDPYWAAMGRMDTRHRSSCQHS